MLLKYNIITLKYIFFISIFVTLSLPANSELDLSVEEIIKGRKALFSKNYSTAKKVQTFASKGEFDKAKTLMIEMSENYKNLIKYFQKTLRKDLRQRLYLQFGKIRTNLML